MASNNDPSAQTTRRDFVKTSSALVAGGAAFASGLNIAKAAHAAGSEEIKVALIGCGGRGSMAAVQALKTEGKVVLWAMADAFERRVEESLKRIRRELVQNKRPMSESEVNECVQVPAERQFSGLDAYQKAIDSGVDLVIHATPPGFRPQHVEAVIQAGKHLFTEKPLAVDAPGVRKVLAAGKLADEKGLKIGVGLQRHHDPGYIETVRRLQDGAIGEILFTRVYWNSGELWLRTRTDFANAYGHEPTEMEYQINNWYYFNWLCGDHIVEQHIHNIDVSNWLKGAHPVSARGMGGREVRTSNDFGQIFDHHSVEFTYEDGSTMMSQCRHQNGCWNKVAEFATGTKGSSEVSRKMIESAGEKWRYRGEPIDPYQQEHDDLFAAIRNDTPFNEMEYGAHSTMTAIMGRMATYSGKQVSWEKAINSEIDFSPEKYDFAADPPAMPDAEGNYPVPKPGKTNAV